MAPLQATVVENDKPSLGILALARLNRRIGDITVQPNRSDPLNAPEPAKKQFDVVVSGGDAPPGHVLASSRERWWAERIAEALNSRKPVTLEDAENQVRGLIAVGY